MLIENKTGAGGTIAAVDVKRAPPDGYTLMFTNATAMITNRALMKNLAYDSEKDFALISIMPAGSLPMVVSAKTGVKNLGRVRRVRAQDSEGEFRHLCCGILRPHGGRRAQQAVRVAHGAGALSR